MTFHIVFRPVKTVAVDLPMLIDSSRLELSTGIVAIVQIVWPFFFSIMHTLKKKRCRTEPFLQRILNPQKGFVKTKDTFKMFVNL